MKKIISGSAILFLIPLVSSAQSLQVLTLSIGRFFAEEFLRFLIIIAFLFFVINTIRFFVIEATEEEGRRKAKTLAIYGVAAFIFMISFYGLVNFLTESIGLEGVSSPINDYELHKDNLIP